MPHRYVRPLDLPLVRLYGTGGYRAMLQIASRRFHDYDGLVKGMTLYSFGYDTALSTNRKTQYR